MHVDWNNEDAIKQLNYHSVIGLTKVKVSYKGALPRPTRVRDHGLAAATAR